MENELLEQLKLISKEHMEKDKFFHDYAHALGVYSNVEKLLEHENGNRLALLTAALFHDICRDQEDHDKVGAKLAKEILEGIKEFPKEHLDSVIALIEKHEAGQVTQDQKIFSDADKMEAFTPLGFARGLMMFAEWKYPLKKAIFTYEELLKKWYKGFYFDVTNHLVETNYSELKKYIDELKSRYNY